MSLKAKALLNCFSQKAKKYPCQNRSFRLNQFLESIVETQRSFGEINGIDEIVDEFTQRLEATNNWGSQLVTEQLHQVINKLDHL